MNCRAVVLQHVAFEDLDALEPLLRSAGFEIEYLDVPVRPDFVQPALNADLLIVLGGPIGVYQTDDYPFLREEIDVVRRRLLDGRPTLGICLGAQIMAASLGARVYPGEQGKEIGWAPLVLTEEGHRSALSSLEGQQPVLHWHGDTFDVPTGADLLAGSQRYSHQAFAVGDHGLALQFHIEASADGLERWYIGHTGELAQEHIDIRSLRKSSREYAPVANAALASLIAQFLTANLLRIQTGLSERPLVATSPIEGTCGDTD